MDIKWVLNIFIGPLRWTKVTSRQFLPRRRSEFIGRSRAICILNSSTIVILERSAPDKSPLRHKPSLLKLYLTALVLQNEILITQSYS